MAAERRDAPNTVLANQRRRQFMLRSGVERGSPEHRQRRFLRQTEQLVNYVRTQLPPLCDGRYLRQTVDLEETSPGLLHAEFTPGNSILGAPFVGVRTTIAVPGANLYLLNYPGYLMTVDEYTAMQHYVPTACDVVLDEVKGRYVVVGIPTALPINVMCTWRPAGLPRPEPNVYMYNEETEVADVLLRTGEPARAVGHGAVRFLSLRPLAEGEELLTKPYAEDFFDDWDEHCAECGGKFQPLEVALLCRAGENCQAAWHPRCAPGREGHSSIPEGDWYCPDHLSAEEDERLQRLAVRIVTQADAKAKALRRSVGQVHDGTSELLWVKAPADEDTTSDNLHQAISELAPPRGLYLLRAFKLEGTIYWAFSRRGTPPARLPLGLAERSQPVPAFTEELALSQRAAERRLAHERARARSSAAPIRKSSRRVTGLPAQPLSKAELEAVAAKAKEKK